MAKKEKSSSKTASSSKPTLKREAKMPDKEETQQIEVKESVELDVLPPPDADLSLPPEVAEPAHEIDDEPTPRTPPPLPSKPRASKRAAVTLAPHVAYTKALSSQDPAVIKQCQANVLSGRDPQHTFFFMRDIPGADKEACLAHLETLGVSKWHQAGKELM